MMIHFCMFEGCIMLMFVWLLAVSNAHNYLNSFKWMFLKLVYRYEIPGQVKFKLTSPVVRQSKINCSFMQYTRNISCKFYYFSNFRNSWEKFDPHSNVLWLHYLADKLVYSTTYSSSNARKDRDVLRQFRQFMSQMLKNKSSTEMVVDALFLNS